MVKILETGMLSIHPDKRLIPYTMRLLDEGDFSAVYQLQQEVVSKLEHEGLFLPLSQDELMNVLSGVKSKGTQDLPPKNLIGYESSDLNSSLPEQSSCGSAGGLTAGVFVEGRLAGFRALYFPRCNADNLGIDIGLPKDELNKVVHLEATVVHPDYRGNRLQQRMSAASLHLLKEYGSFRYLCGTVAVDNIPSIKEKLAVGMYLVQLKVKYGDHSRFIFYQDLGKPLEVEKQSVVWLPLHHQEDFMKENEQKVDSVAHDHIVDLKKHQGIIEKGYFGFKLEQQGSIWCMGYALLQ